MTPLGISEIEGLDEQLSGIADPELRSALGRLGRALLGDPS
jgi:hypothetical protein